MDEHDHCRWTPATPDDLSIVPVRRNRHHCEAAGREQLLAVRHLWRRVERKPQPPGNDPAELMEITRRSLIRDLEELITALDRRVPRVEQAGEAAIASDAVALRAKAVLRLAQLKAEPESRSPRATLCVSDAKAE